MSEEKNEQEQPGAALTPPVNVESQESESPLSQTQEVEKPEESTASGVTIEGPRPLVGSAGSNMTIHSVEFAKSNSRPVPKNTVTIVVNYPKDWKKYRAFKNGDVREVGKEAAEHFIKQGIAKLVNEEEKK